MKIYVLLYFYLHLTVIPVLMVFEVLIWLSPFRVNPITNKGFFSFDRLNPIHKMKGSLQESFCVISKFSSSYFALHLGLSFNNRFCSLKMFFGWSISRRFFRFVHLSDMDSRGLESTQPRSPDITPCKAGYFTCISPAEDGSPGVESIAVGIPGPPRTVVGLS